MGQWVIVDVGNRDDPLDSAKSAEQAASHTTPRTDPAFTKNSAQAADLRNAPIYKDRAIYLAYVSPSDTQAEGWAGLAVPGPARPANRTKITTGLPEGTQAKFIAAAAEADHAGTPLNHLLSTHWSKLFAFSAQAPCLRMDEIKRIGHLVELLRKWVSRRCGSFAYIWVREISADNGQHWHLALHLPKRLRRSFLAYVQILLGEQIADRPRAKTQGRTEGEVACSANGSWHLGRDVHPERRGRWLAAYLGKGEPSLVMFRGQLVTNRRKPVRGDKYDVPQGNVQGTMARTKRFDIARHLKRGLQ